MTVHVIGAGLAGLSTATILADAGVEVAVHEGAPAAGGRCRSYRDAQLGCLIDNGNHLVLTGCTSQRRYLARVRAAGSLVAAPEAAYPFADLASGERWVVSAGRGHHPFWLLPKRGRPPGMTLFDAAGALRLGLARPSDTVADVIRGRGAVWERFWKPMTLAILNAPPHLASARLLAAVLMRTFARGGAHARPMFAPRGFGAAMIEPALRHLAARNAPVRTRRRLLGVSQDGKRAYALTFSDGYVEVGPDDSVVIALPPTALRSVMPALDPPGETAVILNAHFRLLPGALEHAPPLLGVLGGHTQWIFTRGDVVSVTISGAEHSTLARAAPAEVARVLWPEVRAALDLSGEPLAARVLKEKRATFDQSPEGAARRLPVTTPLSNVVLAGDHVATGLPATIEGAIRSGEMAAREVLTPRRLSPGRRTPVVSGAVRARGRPRPMPRADA